MYGERHTQCNRLVKSLISKDIANPFPLVFCTMTVQFYKLCTFLYAALKESKAMFLHQIIAIKLQCGSTGIFF